MKIIFYKGVHHIILTLVALFIVNTLYGQRISEITLYKELCIKTINESADSKTNESLYTNTGTLSCIFNGIHRFYKKFIASQDAGRCPFQPSCSVYFIKSISTNGIIIGVLDGVDRINRCNGLSNNMYDIDIQTNSIIDNTHMRKE